MKPKPIQLIADAHFYSGKIFIGFPGGRSFIGNCIDVQFYRIRGIKNIGADIQPAGMHGARSINDWLARNNCMMEKKT